MLRENQKKIFFSWFKNRLASRMIYKYLVGVIVLAVASDLVHLL